MPWPRHLWFPNRCLKGQPRAQEPTEPRDARGSQQERAGSQQDMASLPDRDGRDSAPPRWRPPTGVLATRGPCPAVHTHDPHATTPTHCCPHTTVHIPPSTLMIHTPPPPHTAVHTPLSTGPPSTPHHPHPIIHTPPSTPYCPHAHHLHTHCPHPSIHTPPSRSQSPHPTVHTPQVQSLVRELKSHMLLRQNTNTRWDECDSNQDCPAPNPGSSAKP